MIKSLVNNVCTKARSIMHTAVKDERGDTNFISILIILGIVIIVAGVFIAFKDQIIGQVQGIIDGFTIH